MKDSTIKTLSNFGAAALILGSSAAFGAPAKLAPAQAGDVVTSELAPSAMATPVMHQAREAVYFSRLATEHPETEPHMSESRGYWFRASAAELGKGLEIHTSAPGALVKLSAMGNSPALDPAALELIDSRGRRFSGEQAMDLSVGNKAMAASGTLFPPGTSAFRIAPERGQGRFIVQAPGLSPDKQSYHVHVQEKQSDLVLRMQAKKGLYVYGQKLMVDMNLDNVSNNARVPVQQVDAEVVSPAGRKLAAEVKRNRDGSLTLALPLDAAAEAAPGLWEVQAAVRGKPERGEEVRRNVKTAFAYAVPQAKLTGDAQIGESDNGDMTATMGIEVGSAGRYQLRGTLYGTNSKGLLQPAVMADTAAWLEAGSKELTLVFDQALLAVTGLSAPYEVRHLELKDQSRMEVLHRQKRAFAIAP
jgi:hypothetical protein